MNLLSSGRLVDEKRIDKRLSEKDERAFEAGYARARSILEHAGAKGIFKTPIAGAHPGGTAKIGEVVDANLQTRFQHLYVCDASVIPGECGIPPVLTLIGLGKRLAKHLAAA